MRYVFGDIVVDPYARLLVIRGKAVRCQARVFDLMVAICEAKGEIVPRAELFKKLWSKNEIASEEALTIAVHKLRSILGERGNIVVTVRGQGIRLAASVEVQGAGAEPSMNVVDDLPHSSVRESTRFETDKSLVTRWWRLIGVPIAALLAIAAFFAFRASNNERYLDVTKELFETDYWRATPDQIAEFKKAIAARNEGHMEEAASLFQTLDAPGGSALPATYAALAYGSEVDGRMGEWADRAVERAREDQNRYSVLLASYAKVISLHPTDTQRSIEQASAVLDMRPKAWNVRVLRARLRIELRDWQGALEDERIISDEIPVSAQGPFLKVRLGLADPTATEAIDKARNELTSVERQVLDGYRLFLAGQFNDALKILTLPMPTEAELEQSGSLDDFTFLLVLVQVQTGNIGDAAAELKRFSSHDRSLLKLRYCCNMAVQSSLLEAQLRHLMNDGAGMASALADARQSLSESNGFVKEEVIAAIYELEVYRLEPEKDHQDIELPQDDNADPRTTGLLDLINARKAIAHSDLGSARALYRRAIERGVMGTYLSAEARLLARQLGEVPEPSDPIEDRLLAPYVVQYAARLEQR